jgi:hypothetical protein
MPQFAMACLMLVGLLHANPMAMPSDAMPLEVGVLGDAVRLQGGVRFRYWGFHAYDIQLWTLPSFELGRYEAYPLALSITYAQSIGVQDLVDRSLTEMTRQAPLTEQQRQPWQQALTRAWRDVRPGDRLTGVFRPPHRAQFYFNGKFIATVDEALLVPRFFGIWLSEQTSQPRLREALLGLRSHDGVVHGW